VLVLLLLTSSLLFWKGENSLKKSSQGYTLFYFENTQSTTTSIKENLSFLIENNKSETMNYNLTHLIDNQEIFTETVEVEGNTIKKIIPSDKLLSEIEKNKDDSFTYQLKTDGNEDSFKLTKKISIE
jgi:hypothetical protein